MIVPNQAVYYKAVRVVGNKLYSVLYTGYGPSFSVVEYKPSVWTPRRVRAPYFLFSSKHAAIEIYRVQFQPYAPDPAHQLWECEALEPRYGVYYSNPPSDRSKAGIRELWKRHRDDLQEGRVDIDLDIVWASSVKLLTRVI